ncbi:cytochrome c [Ramlibacter sp. 2FC]|uniref:c-type cytochrome n=1 Tax=Ramlibacter sp. 2FC TaxID=2502188 RepID=UPI0010F6F359|nr:cytochrome c [Ramlibacter sp. 2FC]
MKRARLFLLGLLVLALAAAAWVWQHNYQDGVDLAAAPAKSTPELVARGAYLARAGNCMACHTARGGAPYAGGRGIETPFGTVYAGNLTPDPETGLGRWTAAHFWRALHHGRSMDGRLLYPAFPYTSTTQVAREDADALFAYLQSLPPVRQAAPAHRLSWPFSTQAALAVWRALYFRPATYRPDPAQSPEWNRGAYLVGGLGHCSACHSARNVLGASGDPLDLSGGLIPVQSWYAPALNSASEAGVADWPLADIVRLLKTGHTPRRSVSGPMSEVVLHSTQYLNEADLGAMAQYLKALPPAAPAGNPAPRAAPDAQVAARGAKLYERHCVQCHGERGQGVAGAYPALAGNRAVNLPHATNLVQMVLYGGFPPATAGNPRPYGMPPFVLQLDDRDVAAVLTHLRTNWGNQAGEVSEFEVNRVRARTGR